MAFSNPVMAYLREYTRYTRINELIDDINELYDLYAAEHDPSDGSHDGSMSGVGWMPAKGFAVAGGTETGTLNPTEYTGSYNCIGASVGANDSCLQFYFLNRVGYSGGSWLTVPVVSYMGPNKYRAMVRQISAIGVYQAVEVNLYDTSDTVVQLSSMTQDDKVACVLYYSGDFGYDAPSISGTWEWLGSRVVDQVFGKQTINKIINNLYVLKEFLSIGHTFATGRHESYLYQGIGALAFCRYDGTAYGFNIVDVENIDTGVYRFKLATQIDMESDGAYPVIPTISTTTKLRVVVLKQAKNYFDVAVYDTSDALSNIGGSDLLSAAAWRYI